MTKELTKNLMCIKMRSGEEIWVEKERIESLIIELGNPNHAKFYQIDNEMINTADVVGIFSPSTMRDLAHRKKGEWKCKQMKWHDRGEPCKHKSKETDEWLVQRNKIISGCSKCDRYGYILGGKVTEVCNCTAEHSKLKPDE